MNYVPLTGDDGAHDLCNSQFRRSLLITESVSAPLASLGSLLVFASVILAADYFNIGGDGGGESLAPRLINDRRRRGNRSKRASRDALRNRPEMLVAFINESGRTFQRCGGFQRS